ncbi:EamA family transporter [Pseudooceanicola sp. MF1-13]|uniref:EamA family transporter n=1 Tax=Pseudooceanicola sp. MF1-13 TaxID=3379095 RepID=UPI003892957F
MPFLGEMFALVSAFFYGFSAVAINKNSENGQADNGAYLSVVMTGLIAGGLWLVLGNPLPDADRLVFVGVAYFALAGILANVSGRVFMFRAVELVGAIEIGLLRRLIPVFAALLAIVFLDERITWSIAVGFALVFSGIFVVLAGNRKSRLSAGAAPPDAPRIVTRRAEDLRRGRILGTVSSASYGGAYVSRKFALDGLPDPLLGTFIGAITGLVCGGLIAPFSRRGRADIASLFRRPALWQAIAAISVSLGQIFQFFALSHTTVTAVAIIGSVEMFIAAWLSAVLLKSEKKPGRVFAFASLLALLGTTVIALG